MSGSVGRLAELFLKTRLGWRDGSNQHEGPKEERPLDLEEARRSKPCDA
jgi:hypothetical protein